MSEAESYSGQRERERVSDKFSIERFVNSCLAKLSKCLHIHSYTHRITSSALNECLLVHNFQNNCSTECQMMAGSLYVFLSSG